jgi:hypothetical protein
MSDRRPARQIALMLSGFLAWAAQFTVVYGVTSVACARGFAETRLAGLPLVPFTILAATAAALAGTGLALARALALGRGAAAGMDPATRFLNQATVLTSGLALVAIAWQGLPVLLVPPCW